jgi:lipopolysaccharide/colanic/teichoic acid biosynthesis glycosyltransferase
MNGFEKFVIGVLSTTAITAVALDAKGKQRRKRDAQQPYYENDHKPVGPYEKYMKRPLDCLLASGALVVFLPILLVTSVLVKKKLGFPVLFTQDRPGKDGKIFKLYKFRTMTDQRDENGDLLPDEKRVTPFGIKLRKSSLDELPELINIAEGDMSIVGPRPLLVKYLPFYNAKEIRRHDVLPGLTGLAQTHGRNVTTWDERFSWDIRYVNHVTFLTDLKAIIDTVKEVFHTDDVRINALEDFDVYREK